VSPARRARALALYREGNRLFMDEKHAEALARYSAAVKEWDHPAIRYNIVECLVNLGRNLEAYEHVQSALRHGAEPLGASLHRQAKTYLTLLERGLSRLRVSCREEGARVVLDGKPLFVGPGAMTRVLLPGVHAVLVTKPGFVTVAQQATLEPGKLASIELRLSPRRPEVVFQRRWQRRWLPWTVLGSGLAIAATALPLYLVGRSDFNSQKERFDRLCSGRAAGGCVPDQLETEAERQEWAALQSLETKANREYQASIALLGVGAAMTLAGVVLVILNQPRAVERMPEEPALRLSRIPFGLTRGGVRAGVVLEF